MLKKFLIVASMICVLVSSLAISCFAWSSEPTYDQSNENLYRYRYEFVFGASQSFPVKDWISPLPVSSSTDEFNYKNYVTMESPFLVKFYMDDSLVNSYYWTNQDSESINWNDFGISHSSRDAGGTGYQQTISFAFGDIGSVSILGVYPSLSVDNVLEYGFKASLGFTNSDKTRYVTEDGNSFRFVVCTDQELPLLSSSGGNDVFSWSMTENVPPSPLVNIFDNLFSGFGVSISGLASGVKESLSSIIWVDPTATNKVLSPLVTFIFTIAGLSIAMTVFFLIFRLIRFGRQR